jgi:lipopolysaccharide export system permease protein
LIITRYLLREIARPLATILVTLVALFASYSAATFLSNAANGLLPAGDIAALTGLKVIIALEVLIPASLYVSVILTFTRLHSDSEIAAMSAVRISPIMLMRAVLMLSACLAVMAGGLSLFVRPWAYQKLHELSGRAATLLDVNELVPGSFYVGRNGTRVIVLAHRNGPGSPARNVFVKLQHSDSTEIISAQLAYALPQAKPGDDLKVYLRDAYIYQLDHTSGAADDVVQAKGIVLDPNSGTVDPPGYSSVAASSTTIARSGSSEDIAEFQWRLSTPLSTLLLGMLGVPLIQAKPREGRYRRMVPAMLIYFVYYLLSTSARTWVQHGEIASFPGIWWVSALLGLLVLAMATYPDLDFPFGRRRA